MQVGPIYEQLQRLKESEAEAQAMRQNRSDKGHNDPHEPSLQLLSTQHGPMSSTLSINAAMGRQSYQRGSGSFGSKGQHGPPLLSTIPDVYFDPDFRLENPRIFDVVSERSDIVPPTSTTGTTQHTKVSMPRKALATNAILQEKLSWYMDTVEWYLASCISRTSTVFLSALGSLQDLHSIAAELVQQVRALRKNLMLLDCYVVTEGLELVQKRQKLYNLGQLNDAVLQLKHIVDSIAYSELLVDQGAVEQALTEIHVTELLMAGKRNDALTTREGATHVRLHDLRRAVALQGVVSDMATLRFRIGQVFESKVHDILIGDLRRHIQSISIEEVLRRWEALAALRRAKPSETRESSALPAYMQLADELRAALLPHLSGLHRARFISTAIQAYRELVLREIRNAVRRPLPSSANDAESVTSMSTVSGEAVRTEQEKSSILARNLRALDAADAERMFSTIFISVTETLRRLKTQSSILLDIACGIQNLDGNDPVKSPRLRDSDRRQDPAINAPTFEVQEEMHTALDLPGLLAQAVDISHEKINKILRVRSGQSINLPLVYFLRYFKLNLLFATECEAASGRSGASLQMVVNSHIQGFIHVHQEKEIVSLAQAMDADKWQTRDLTAKDTEILQQILECNTANAPAWTEFSKLWTPPPQNIYEETSDTRKIMTANTVRGATIGEETFLLPHSAIVCLEGVSNFFHLIGGIPSKTSDIAVSLTSYIQLFDSRCRQLILGAGALRSAGLKNITTTQLALASRAISFIAAIIPHVREFVHRHVPAGQPTADLMRQFDKVQRALQEHEEAIYEKSVEIMASRAGTMCEKGRKTTWDEESATTVRKYMIDLVKDTSKLYKALGKYLPKQAVRLVMIPVFTSYKDQLGNLFDEANPKTETGCDWYDPYIP